MPAHVAVAALADAAFLLAALRAARRNGMLLRVTEARTLALLAAAAAVQIRLLAISPGSLGAALACGAAGVCAVTDAQTGYVFDAVSYPALAAVLAVFAFNGEVMQCCAGVFVAAGLLALLYAATRGRGLGLGDVKLAACIGGGVGAACAWRAIEASFVLGGLWSAYALLTRRARRGEAVAFAPFLFFGTALAVEMGIR